MCFTVALRLEQATDEEVMHEAETILFAAQIPVEAQGLPRRREAQ